jgi:hypothetical protein
MTDGAVFQPGGEAVAVEFRPRSEYLGYKAFSSADGAVLLEPRLTGELRNAAELAVAERRVTGGLLYGRAWSDAQSRYLVVDGYLEAGPGENDGGGSAGGGEEFILSPAELRLLRRDAARMYTDSHEVGWWRTLPELDEFSSRDLETQSALVGPDGVGLLVYGSGDHWGTAYLGGDGHAPDSAGTLVAAEPALTPEVLPEETGTVPEAGEVPGVSLSATAQRIIEDSGRLRQVPDATAVLLSAFAARDGKTADGLLSVLAQRQGETADDLFKHLESAGFYFREPQLPDQLAELLRVPALASMLHHAVTLAERTSGSRRVHARHLLAAAVLADDPPLEAPLLSALGTSAAELPGLVLDAVLAAVPSEPGHPWDELLAVRLAGGFDRDLVDPNRAIKRDRDDLEHSVWAAMFASVIAARETPMPVSIGLFAEWGAGKSTFMGLLRGEIEALRGQPGCVRDVVQIGFNAWHYADANLWASLGDEIFSAMADALTPPREAPPTVQAEAERLRVEIADGLVATKELKARAAQARQQSEALAVQVRDARQNRRVTARQLATAALNAPALRKQLDRAWRRLGIEDEVTQGELLADELDGISRDGQALRAIAGQRVAWALAALCVAALLVTLAGSVIPVSWAPRLRDSGAIGTVALVLGSALTLARRTSSGLAALRSVAAQAASDADARSDQAIKSARDRLRHAESTERAAEAELRRVSADIEGMRRELVGLAPGQRLYTFLAERAASVDYSGQLGLVSTIRKDFKHLVRVLDEQRKATMPDEDAVADVDSGAQPRRVDRIVLYIDDLDRCRPQQVVEVLEAVHLLLALDLFVVVVGVDPRWLVQSLREQYPGILAQGDGPRQGGHLAEAAPADYLQKIFNIPFSLPSFRGDQLGLLVRRLAGEPAVADTAAGPAAAVAQARQSGAAPGEIVAPAPAPEPAADIGAEPGSQVAAIQTATGNQASESSASGLRARRLTEDELLFLGGLGPFVRTPRDAKRLFNVYRMLRSTRDLSPAAAFLGGEYQAVAVLLAMLTLDARVSASVLDAAPDPLSAVSGGLTRRVALREEASGGWASFTAGLSPQKDGRAWRNAIIGQVPAAEVAGWQRMAAAVGATSALVTLPDLTAFQAWAPHVRRFSYLVLAPGD